MTTHIRSFTTFSLFFIGTSMAFWPLVISLVASAAAIPALFYWDADFLLNAEMLISGIHLPLEDWSLILLVPLFMLGAPLLYAYFDGQLMESQQEVYEVLINSIGSVYGLLGWFLTLFAIGAYLYFTVWSVRKALNFTHTQTAQYLAIWTVICGMAVALI